MHYYFSWRLALYVTTEDDVCRRLVTFSLSARKRDTSLLVLFCASLGDAFLHSILFSFLEKEDSIVRRKVQRRGRGRFCLFLVTGWHSWGIYGFCSSLTRVSNQVFFSKRKIFLPCSTWLMYFPMALLEKFFLCKSSASFQRPGRASLVRFLCIMHICA